MCSALEGAVSLEFLQAFAAEVLEEGGLRGDPTTEQVVRRIILPRTAELSCRYADHPELIHEEQLGGPTFYISHAWANSFTLLVDSVSSHLAGCDPEQVFLFIDIFSVNQHPGADRAYDMRVRATDMKCLC